MVIPESCRIQSPARLSAPPSCSTMDSIICSRRAQRRSCRARSSKQNDQEENAVQRVTDQVEARYLEQIPPRALPHVVMLNLLGDYAFERPISAFLDPLLISAVLALIVLVAAHSSALLLIVPLLV